SRAFVRRWFPGGATARKLRAAPVVIFNRKDVLHDRFLRRGGGAAGPTHTQIVPSPHAFVEATRLGLGWGLNPEPLVERVLDSKRLVDLTPGEGRGGRGGAKPRAAGRAAAGQQAPRGPDPRRVAGCAALLATVGPCLAHARC